MYAIVFTTIAKGIQPLKTWKTFKTEEERNIAYGKLFIEAQTTGCGPECDHFSAGEGWFEHCLIGRVEKVPVLKLFDN